MKKIILTALIGPFLAQAGLFKLTCTSTSADPGGCATFGQAAFDAIAVEVNKKLPSADNKDQYFEGMAGANAMSAAGVTTSYGTVFKRFLVGVTASGGAHLGSKSFSDFGDLRKNPEQFRGFGAQAALVFGTNLGRLLGRKDAAEGEKRFFDLNRLNVYLSGFKINQDFDDVKGDYMGFGIGAQYRLFDQANWGAKLVKWTGLDVSAGLLYSKLDVEGLIPLNNTYTGNSGGTNYSATYTGKANLEANVGTVTIPLEVSSGLRLFYFFKLIAGFGVDFNMGKTDGSGSLTQSAFSASGGGNTVNGTAEFDIKGSGSPPFANMRLFVGPHIEFGVGSVFLNLHRSLTQNAVAANAGVNFFW